MKHRTTYIAAAALLGWTATAFAQTANPEIEPNDFKSTASHANSGGGGLRATPAPAPTDTINGFCTGSAVDGSVQSRDYFLLQTEPMPKDIYCYSIEDSSATGHVVSIRALSQSNGMISAGTDVVGQLSTGTTSMNIWYGTGTGEALYIQVAGNAALVGPYGLMFRCTKYTPVPVGPFIPSGPLNIRASADGAVNLDFWVYDSELNPIPGYGHDDPDTAGLTRDFAPGRYYVALTDGNLLNDQPSPSDDTNRSKPVADFPNCIFSSSAIFPITNMGITITAGGIIVGSAFDTKVHRFQVLMFSFDVVAPCPPCTTCPPCAADYNQDGGIDGADVGAFFSDWSAGAGCGDVNNDGGIDGSDVAYFFHVWEGGGC